ncbi:hypothetical protein MNBD_ALPHA11-981 [hydrothermal vent metagenome]|uniref:Uncharacterized protein n=1 Tax=hydrothermal vent metagenome TaxID=652676 RepID=A0A3B0UKL7_9ZZZZ
MQLCKKIELYNYKKPRHTDFTAKISNNEQNEAVVEVATNKSYAF